MSVDSQLSTQESQVSEDWGTEDDEEEEDYGDYYGNDDVDAMSVEGEGVGHDASFQRDPEFYEFSCLSSEETWNFLDSQVREVSRKLKVDVPSSRVMLQALHWDDEGLAKRYGEDRQKVLLEVQLKTEKDHHGPKFHDYCPVCLTPTSECKLHGLACGHMFCSQCWLNYLCSKISSGTTTTIECMECPVRMSLEMVSSLLQSSAEIYAKFLRKALAEFVHSHVLLRWCPGVECSIVFQVKLPQAKLVTCSKCNTSCCFKCGEEYHCPTDCDTLKQWLAKCHDDSETAHYIQANTKDCPNCHTAIEKNGGCNHMNCSQCHFDFCWMCLGAWKSHNGYFNCSKFAEKSENAEKINNARNALEKYLFYYQRWANHDQSLKLEEATRRKILARIEEKVADGVGTWIDWQYLRDAAKLLRKCRYTLKYTYPYAYYMESDRKPLFEFQQAELEVEIENLSWKVERADVMDIADMRQQMNVAEVKRLTLLRDFVP